ncbi:SUKH-3 domain-containing protein [Salinispora tropica]|uniref:SUKH-3 domain-containing protein n=1 Tax=Salinispora tropica TaxID=168695 RepID=UPI0004184DD6|nr:SUKH-3 domain-containing protein [Salinispora tropica]
MISRDEALARARRWAAAGRPGPPPEVDFYEFDLGFVASRRGPTPQVADGPPRPPSATGQATVVIDRETGELSRWPSLPIPALVERYAQHRAAEGRFPPDVREVLDQAGWFPGRDMTAAVDLWLAHFADELAGLECFPAARAALIEFGGLILPQVGGGRYWSSIQPTRSNGVVTESSEVFAEEFDNPVFPLGNNDDGPSELAMDAQGRVFQLHWADDFFIGPDIDTAIIALIRGGRMPAASDLTWRTDN